MQGMEGALELHFTFCSVAMWSISREGQILCSKGQTGPVLHTVSCAVLCCTASHVLDCHVVAIHVPYTGSWLLSGSAIFVIVLTFRGHHKCGSGCLGPHHCCPAARRAHHSLEATASHALSLQPTADF